MTATGRVWWQFIGGWGEMRVRGASTVVATTKDRPDAEHAAETAGTGGTGGVARGPGVFQQVAHDQLLPAAGCQVGER